MQSTQSDAQITQSGQAIKMNNATCESLKSLFSVSLGPNGTYKAIITPGQTLTITKNGNVLCKDIQFINPTSIIITKAAASLYSTYGDGSISFIVLCSDIFNSAYKYFQDGVSITSICTGLQNCITDISKYIESLSIGLENDDQLNELSYNLLNTKLSKQNSKLISPMITKAIKNISKSQFQDVNMVEVIKMNEGDVNDTKYIDGLVLDHGNRHYGMPTKLSDVVVMVTNMSLEYEKPEINAQFVYSSSKQREELVKNEREFILKKAQLIGEFADKIKNEMGKSLLLISEKGIDPFSLDILAKHNILALRRAKRRNMERLMYMCGGNIISEISQLDVRNLGYCANVRVVNIGEEKYTYLEGTPYKGSCTILIRADTDNEMNKMNNAIRGTLKVCHNTYKDKRIILGGVNLYQKLVRFLNSRLQEINEKDVIGYEILKQAYTNMIKYLLRNKGSNIHEELVKILREDIKHEEVYDSFTVVSGVLNNSAVVSMSLLMVDEIIKAGKCVKEEKTPN
ncbi:T-complex protein 1 subunit zeta (CCT6) [Vairimorpha necatrix]|uniref:T-complex protein 1 subunit zeta (CCT6) n=1 Tax=Vairimorpha necatrix TaxID=6039 RepID=A0AAX4J9Y3_9MICR